MSCNLVRTAGSERASCEFLTTRLSVLTFDVIERHRVSRNILVSIVEVITKEDTDLYKSAPGKMTNVRRGRYEKYTNFGFGVNDGQLNTWVSVGSYY